MATGQTIHDSVAYRVALVQPGQGTVLVEGPVGDRSLPRVRVAHCSRRASDLRAAIRDEWSLCAFVVDYVGDDADVPCVVAEVQNANPTSKFSTGHLDQIRDADLGDWERAEIESLLNGRSKYAVSQIGWIEDAIAWVESVTGRKVQSNTGVEQFNGGRGFALLRVRVEDGREFWLKATGEPHMHELATTALLSELAGDYLPEIIASKPEWNAWLMSAASAVIGTLPTDPVELFSLLERVVVAMAELQARTVGHAQDLRRVGAFDQSAAVLAAHSHQMFDYLEEAMDKQTSTRVPVIPRTRLAEIRNIFDQTCGRMGELNLPETVIHGDLSTGNLVMRGQECRFIDWSEAYVGNPLITLQHILLLNQAGPPELIAFMNQVLTDRYRKVIERVCDPASIDEALIYMPLLAAASALYGRGDWVETTSQAPGRRHAYARTLARHMDRAASDPSLLNALSAKSGIGSRVSVPTTAEAVVHIAE